MLSKFRSQSSKIMEPIAKAIARTGVTPNTLTLIGLLMGAAVALLFAFGFQFFAGFALLVAGFFDMIDGAVARATGKETAFGGVLDSTVDRYTDFIIYAGVIYATVSGAIVWPALIIGAGWMWGILAIAGSFMVSYVRARAEAAGTGKLDVGFAERAERMIILAFGGMLLLTAYAVVLIAIITHITMIHRILVAWRRLKRAPSTTL